VFVDESGASTAMDRTHGRAASGVRVDGPVPHGHWKIVTLTAAVRLDGVPESACLAFDGATDTACFEAYIAECLAPALRPGDIVIMDNLSCHKTAEVARLIAAAGAEVRYLPAYSPDLNPIERLFSKLKAYLRSAAARTIDGLIDAMGDALRSVRPGDILGWFRHSGRSGRAISWDGSAIADTKTLHQAIHSIRNRSSQNGRSVVSYRNLRYVFLPL
jgi:transposase